MNKTTMRWVLGLALMVAIAFALAWRDRFDAAALQAWVEGAGGARPVLFMGLYAVAALLLLPGAFVYTWLGHAGREALSGGDGLVRNVTIAVSLLAAVALLPRLVRQIRAKPMIEVLGLKREVDAGEDVLLLDVRTTAEFNADSGHIAQARNVPLGELPERLAEFERREQRPVRLICRTDRRSAQAARLFAEAGFSHAPVIRGGMTAWRAHGWAAVST